MSKLFANLIINSPSFLKLKRDFQSEKAAHAYLLVSPDTLATKLTAQMFALFCLGGDFKGLAEFNADMHFVGSKAADIDEMLKSVLNRPSKASQKFYIITGADTLSTICQNKLLKTLEEPPEATTIILCASSKAQILAPVLSRARELELDSFSSYDIANELREHSGALDTTIKLAAELSVGSLQSAHEFCTDKNKPIIFSKTLDVLKETLGSKNVLAGVAQILPYKEATSFIITLIESILRDTLMLHLGVPALIKLKSHKDDLVALQQIYSIAAIEHIMPLMTKMRKRIKFNANHNSLVDELVFGLAELRNKYK